MKRATIIIFLLFTIFVNAQEGTKQLMPNSNDRLWLEIYRDTDRFFATYRASEDERLHIYLNSGETMHFGMKMASYLNGNANRTTFRIKDESGAIVYAEARFPPAGENGYIDTYTEAVTGPNGVVLNGTTITSGYIFAKNIKFFAIKTKFFAISKKFFSINAKFFSTNTKFFSINAKLFAIHTKLFVIHAKLFVIHAKLFAIHTKLFVKET